MNKKNNPKNVKNINVTIRMTASDIQKLDSIVECSKLTRANVLRALVNKSKPCTKLRKD
mgnify:CR=1 FL=1